MGTHPNAILMCVLTPDDLARKTFRAIAAECGAEIDDDSAALKILGRTIEGSKGSIEQTDFSMMVMESDYDDGYQISAPEGSIIVHDYVTYGYGEVISWADLEAIKNKLEEWAKGICERHKCSYVIQLTQNFW